MNETNRVTDAAQYETETERLRLRLHRPEDVEFMCAIRTDPAVTRFFESWYTFSIEKAFEAIPRMSAQFAEHGYGEWLVERKSDRRPIGYGGLQALNGGPEVEVFYGLNPEFWGFGYATEIAAASLRLGFERAGLSRIFGVVHPANVASCRVLEKVGMRYIGMARFFEFDERVYKITRAEWQALEPTAGDVPS